MRHETSISNINIINNPSTVVNNQINTYAERKKGEVISRLGSDISVQHAQKEFDNNGNGNTNNQMNTVTYNELSILELENKNSKDSNIINLDDNMTIKVY